MIRSGLTVSSTDPNVKKKFRDAIEMCMFGMRYSVVNAFSVNLCVICIEENRCNRGSAGDERHRL